MMMMMMMMLMIMNYIGDDYNDDEDEECGDDDYDDIDEDEKEDTDDDINRDAKSGSCGRYICAILSMAVLIMCIVYIVIINKCDKIPALIFLAKHLSHIMLFISQLFP